MDDADRLADSSIILEGRTVRFHGPHAAPVCIPMVDGLTDAEARKATERLWRWLADVVRAERRDAALGYMDM